MKELFQIFWIVIFPYATAIGVGTAILNLATSKRRDQLLTLHGARDCPVSKQLAGIKKEQERRSVGLPHSHTPNPPILGTQESRTPEESLKILEELRERQLITHEEYQNTRLQILEKL